MLSSAQLQPPAWNLAILPSTQPKAPSVSLSRLSWNVAGTPVIPVFALPLPDGRYRMVYEHPVEPPDPTRPEAIHEFTQRCTDVLEMYVRRHPHLWLWMHRRWRDDDVDGDTHLTGMFPAAATDESESRG